MRHPRDDSAYTGGHVRDAYLPFGGPESRPVACADPPPDNDFDVRMMNCFPMDLAFNIYVPLLTGNRMSLTVYSSEETRLQNLFTVMAILTSCFTPKKHIPLAVFVTADVVHLIYLLIQCLFSGP